MAAAYSTMLVGIAATGLFVFLLAARGQRDHGVGWL
jgi:hypothetical protein